MEEARSNCTVCLNKSGLDEFKQCGEDFRRYCSDGRVRRSAPVASRVNRIFESLHLSERSYRGTSMSKKNTNGNRKNIIHAVIETPSGSRNKYAWDKKLKAFRLKKVLPSGMTFPFNFGYLPGTKAEDGDPLDVLVLTAAPAFPGCVLDCVLLGAIEAEQRNGKGKFERNDRLIAVDQNDSSFSNIQS